MPCRRASSRIRRSRSSRAPSSARCCSRSKASANDICAVGQTAAAHDLCSGLRPYLSGITCSPASGTYGVFSGNRWNNQIYPLLKNVILASE